jgi:hypothetical protein
MFDSGYAIRINGINHQVIINADVSRHHFDIDTVTFIAKQINKLQPYRMVTLKSIRVYLDSYKHEIHVQPN